ncbi:AMFR protein-like protein [Pyrenochaeta sp. DS3sAY3a]|nr:AMFR protein-like protein [Pyrenochaeta sp. DS3sAY3a]
MAEQSVNIPQVLVFIVVTFLAVRWYFSKPTSSDAPATSSRSAPRISPAQIDQLAQMFPQLTRRDIAWDLQRNGGNVSATTERVLSGRGLDPAPASFAPPAPRAAAVPARTPVPVAKNVHPDLITRYNLSSKLSQPSEPAPEEQPKAKAWSQDRNERQSNLQKRREEMILAARRKLEDKEKAKASS